MRNWYYFNWLCGDHIVEQHIHNLDVGNWVHAARSRSRANGMGGRQVRTGKRLRRDLRPPLRRVHLRRRARACSASAATSPAAGTASRNTCTAPKAAANISGTIETKDEKWRFRSPNPDPYQVEHDDLFAAIRTGADYNEAEYGATSTLTSIMGRMATYSGKVIEWEDALNSELSLMPDEFTWDAKPKSLPKEDGSYEIAMPGITRAL